MLCVQRCPYAYLSCNECLSELLLPSYEFKAMWLFPSKAGQQTNFFHPENCHLLDIFSFSVHSMETLVMAAFKQTPVAKQLF